LKANYGDLGYINSEKQISLLCSNVKFCALNMSMLAVTQVFSHGILAKFMFNPLISTGKN
jgi:hypothetical protein